MGEGGLIQDDFSKGLSGNGRNGSRKKRTKNEVQKK